MFKMPLKTTFFNSLPTFEKKLPAPSPLPEILFPSIVHSLCRWKVSIVKLAFLFSYLVLLYKILMILQLFHRPFRLLFIKSYCNIHSDYLFIKMHLLQFQAVDAIKDLANRRNIGKVLLKIEV